MRAPALRSGENRAWPDGRVTAYVDGARVAALLVGADGRATTGGWVPTGATVAGVSHLPGPVEGVTVDLARVPGSVAKVLVVVSGWTAAPTAQLLTTDGTVAVTVTAERLTTERALVMAEVYRRGETWKVRALALGHAGGLRELAASYGAPDPTASATPPAPPPPAPSPPAPSPQASSPQAPSPTTATAGPTVDAVRQLGMILDDASRTTASFESSADYARRRLEQDLEQLVGHPSLRMGPAAEAARGEAQGRHDALVAEARRRYDADLGQLREELGRLEQTLAPALAPWHAPGWTAGGSESAGGSPWAIRLGDIALEAAPDFRMPMVRGVPLLPPLWIETEDGGDAVAARMMAALAARIALATPLTARVSGIDVGGPGGLGHALGELASGRVAEDANDAARLVHEHVEHLELLGLAREAGGVRDLAPEQRPGRLLLVADLPGGLDESTVAGLAHLVHRGAELGTSVVLAGRRPQGLGIPVLDLLHDVCLRVPTGPGGDLVDTHGRVGWVFHPDLGPLDPLVAEQVDAVVRRRVRESGLG